MGRRVVVGRMRDSRNRGVVAIGVVQLEEADPTKDYTATISIKENGGELAGSPVSITLAAGSELNADENADEDIQIRKRQLGSSDAIEIVARYRVFNVSGQANDRYDIAVTLHEAGVVVVNGGSQMKFA